MMRSALGLLAVALFFCCPALPDKSDAPVAVAQRLFDAMKAHDGAAATQLFLPGSSLASVDANGKVKIVPFETFVEHIGSSEKAWLERIRNPKVLEQGNIAAVWADYNFYLDGKLSHCGIDSFSLLKTPDGWKIASVSDTRETVCTEH